MNEERQPSGMPVVNFNISGDPSAAAGSPPPPAIDALNGSQAGSGPTTREFASAPTDFTATPISATTSTAPAVREPRWSGKKTAITAALAVGLATGGALAAAAAVPQGSSLGGDDSGPGNHGQRFPGGQLPGGQVPGGQLPGGQFPGAPGGRDHVDPGTGQGITPGSGQGVAPGGAPGGVPGAGTGVAPNGQSQPGVANAS